MVTVFTPTYNRAFIVTNLYNSLCRQTSNDFEWLIVDDGSTDNTEAVIKSFISEDRISIRYVKQSNGGKHRAINKGVRMANGELFFIVDSDDFLTDDAIEQVEAMYVGIKDDCTFAGLSGIRIYPDGNRIGGEHDFGILDCSPLDLRLKHHVKGDMAEIWRTDILHKYPFPDIEGEKFVPETLIWNRIGKKYKTRYFSKGIYICEYLPDGLSSKATKIRMTSPLYSMTLYSEQYRMDIPFIEKLKSAINFWRFTPLKYIHRVIKFNMFNTISLCCFPLGFAFKMRDKITL